MDFAEWRRIMRVNLDGVFLMSRASSDEMRRRGYGRTANSARNTFFAGTPKLPVSSAARAGWSAFTRAWPRDSVPYASRFTALSPASTAWGALWPGPHAEALAPLGTLQGPKGGGGAGDLGAAGGFPALEEAGWVTGSTVNVDGGHVRH